MLAALPNAIASWWTHPLAVRDGPRVWVSGIAALGTQRLYRVDAYGTGVCANLGGQDQADDHNAGAIALDMGEQQLIVFYSRHNTDPWVRYRFVDRDTMIVGDEQHLTFGETLPAGTCTYAQVVQYGGWLWVITRVQAGDFHEWRYRVSVDWGESWEPERRLVSSTAAGQPTPGIYCVVRPDPADPGVAHLATYRHPAGQADGGWHNAGVTTVDLDHGLPEDLDVAALEQAIAPGGITRFRLLDVSGYDSGAGPRPMLAYAVWSGENGAATYKVKRWDGDSWTTSDWQLPAGQTFGHSPAAHYHGGVTFDAHGGLVSSRHDGEEWVIERWRPAGSAPTSGFVLLGELDRGPSRLIRPSAVRDDCGTVVWQHAAEYGPFTSYTCDLMVGR